MTQYTFLINGVDFADVIDRHGYKTDRVPVYSKRITTLDGYDHEVRTRWRGTLEITTNPIKTARARELAAALAALPAEIKYHSFQVGEAVTQIMRLTALPMELALVTPSANWINPMVLTFEQL